MSRYIQLHRKIWSSRIFPFLSDDAKLVFLHASSTPLGNQFGCYRAGILSLSEELRWSKERYRKAFGEALSKGLIEHDEKFLVVRIPGFLDYNKPGNPNILIRWGRDFEELPDSPLKYKTFQQLKAFAEALGEAYQEAFAKGFSTVSVTETVSVTTNKQHTMSSSEDSAPAKTDPQPKKNGTQIPKADVEEVFSCWAILMEHPRAQLGKERYKAIRDQLADGYSVADLCHAVVGCKRSAHHMGYNGRRAIYDRLTLIFRNSTNVDRFIGYRLSPPKPYWKPDEHPPAELCAEAERFYRDAVETANREREQANVVSLEHNTQWDKSRQNVQA